MGQINRVTDDVGFFFQCRRNIDRGVGDHQWPVVGRDIHQEDVADPPTGTQAIGAGDDFAHQFIGVQAALHQGFGVAGANQRDRECCGIVAVCGIDDADSGKVDGKLFGNGADAVFRANQNRFDDASLKCHHRPLERLFIAGMGDGSRNGFESFDPSQHLGEAGLLVVDMDLRGVVVLQAGNFLAGCQNLCRSDNDLQAFLIGAGAVENDVPVVIELLLHRDGDDDPVANGDWTGEVQRLVDQNGAWAGKLSRQDGRNERAAPHAVGDGFAKHATLGIFGINRCRVDVAGEDGKKLHILGHQGSGQRRAVTDSNFVVSLVDQITLASLVHWLESLLPGVFRHAGCCDVPGRSRGQEFQC